MGADYYLSVWSKNVRQRLLDSGYQKTSLEWRIWRKGMVKGPINKNIPNYWPDRLAEQVNNEILTLPIKLQDPLIVYYLMEIPSVSKMAKMCECSRLTFKRRLYKARQLIGEKVCE